MGGPEKSLLSTTNTATLKSEILKKIRLKTNPIYLLGLLFLLSCTPEQPIGESQVMTQFSLVDQDEIITYADELLTQSPVTVTAFTAERSSGGKHDYYSEGAYWWPDSEHPDGPYVRRDGVRNPNNFTSHKIALVNFSEWVATLTAAYLLTNDERYANHAIRHLEAWFLDAGTRMNPSLLYGQAIEGITTGRGIGLIDTIRLINVALSVEILRKTALLNGEKGAAIGQWFADFGDWMTTHPYGHEERDNNNNHSTWWGAQVAAYARVSGRNDLLEISKQQFKNQLEIQLADDGSLPDELGRTKPFHYVNYTLRAWATYAALVSTKEENFWGLQSSKSNLAEAVNWLLPTLKDTSSWTYLTELEPTIRPHKNDFLVFANWGLGDETYLEIWQELPSEEGDNHANLVLWQKLKGHE